MTLFQCAEQHGDRTAIVDGSERFSYRQVLDASAATASALLNGAKDLGKARVAFLVPPCFACAATQWGIWRAGGVAVPLAMTHPRPELEYVVDDSQASLLVIHPELEERLKPIAEARGLRLVRTTDVFGISRPPLPEVDESRRAMILYTSGTTSKPKGVVTTHANIRAQVESLVKAWEWNEADHILHILPLHHIHQRVRRGGSTRSRVGRTGLRGVGDSQRNRNEGGFIAQMGPGASRRVQGAIASALSVGTSAQCNGQDHKAGSCEIVYACCLTVKCMPRP